MARRDGLSRALGSEAGLATFGRRLDILLVAVVVAVAAWMRIQFVLTGAPTFVTPDSDDYLRPAYDLAHGLGFDPELRRTPLYPLFVALVLWPGGNLATVALVQHVLGGLTAALTYALGRAAFGAPAGLLAGLAVAVSGPLLIYEHYLMAEALFTLLLTLAVLLLVLAIRHTSAPGPAGAKHSRTGVGRRGEAFAQESSPSGLPGRECFAPTCANASSLHARDLRLWLAAGVATGLVALTRPVGQVVFPVALGSPLLIALPSVRAGARRSLLVGVGILVVLSPWMLRNWAVHGTLGAEGALGQALIGRTVRHDKGFVYDDPARPDPDPTRAAARRIIQQEAATGEPSGGTITQRVREELGLTQAQTSALMRALAVDAILQRPGYYLGGTAEIAWKLFQGVNDRLPGHWRQRTTRNWDRRWDARLVPLLDVEVPAEGQPLERADALTSLFQPWRWWRPIAWLFGLGVLCALVVPRWRPAMLPAIVSVSLILAAAALDGLVWRFRYPADPLIAVVAAGGLTAAPMLALSWRRPASGAASRQ